MTGATKVLCTCTPDLVFGTKIQTQYYIGNVVLIFLQVSLFFTIGKCHPSFCAWHTWETSMLLIFLELIFKALWISQIKFPALINRIVQNLSYLECTKWFWLVIIQSQILTSYFEWLFRLVFYYFPIKKKPLY